MTWIVADREHLGGKLRVTGTRISIEFLLDVYACGTTVREIAEEYPGSPRRPSKAPLRTPPTRIASPRREDPDPARLPYMRRETRILAHDIVRPRTLTW